MARTVMQIYRTKLREQEAFERGRAEGRAEALRAVIGPEVVQAGVTESEAEGLDLTDDEVYWLLYQAQRAAAAVLDGKDENR